MMNLRKLATYLSVVLATLILFCSPVQGQNTTVTATASDTDGQTWNNGTWQATFYANPSYPNLGVYNINGVPLDQTKLQWKGSLNGSAAFTQAMYNNSLISPAGSMWVFQFCPNASSPCASTPPLTVSGGSLNITPSTNALAPVRFTAVASAPYAYGYADAELVPPLSPGGMYYNVSTSNMRLWSGTAWSNIGGGGITLTTTGTSGPSTLVGSALNIPVYSSGGGTVGPSSAYFTPFFDTPTTIQGTPLGMPAAAWGVYPDGGATTTTNGTWAVGTTGNINGGCGTYGPGKGNMFIAGAGPAGADFTSAVVSCTAGLVVLATPTSTSVPTGTFVQHDNTPQGQLALNWEFDNLFCFGIGECYSIMPLIWPSGTTSFATPLEFRGESQSGTAQFQTVLKGGRASDIFRAPDKADSPARRCCMNGGTFHDMTLLVDGANDANTFGSLTKQAAWAAQGRQGLGGSDYSNYYSGWSAVTLYAGISAGATSIGVTGFAGDPLSNYHLGVATTGWLKIDSEWIYYHGIDKTSCGAAPYCLLNVVRGKTLAGQVSTAATHTISTAVTPVNPLAPANVTDWIPALTVGACAMVFPARDGNQQQGVPYEHGSIYNLYLSSYGNVTSWPVNNSCGIYIQGSFYAGTIHNVASRFLVYGFMMAPPFTNTDAPQTFGQSSDGMVFDRFDFNNVVPFSTYLGGHNTVLSNSTMYAGSSSQQQAIGITLYSNPCHVYGACQNSEMTEWGVENFYQEWNDGGGAIVGYGPMSEIDGYSHHFKNGFMNAPSALIGPTDWSAWYSDIKGFTFNNIQINGSLNDFKTAENVIANTPNASIGYDNQYKTIHSQYGYRSQNVLLARPAMNSISPDFLVRGAISGDQFQSQEDLIMLPEDLNNNPTIGTTSNQVLLDATALPYGRYVPIAAPGAIAPVGYDGNVGIPIGQRFPKGTGTVLVYVKAGTGGGTQNYYLDCQSGHAGSVLGVALTGAWQWVKFSYNSTVVGAPCPLGGQGAWLRTDATSNGTDLRLAALAIIPDYDYLTVSGQLKAGQLVATTLSITGGGTIAGGLTVTGGLNVSGGITGLAPLVLQGPTLSSVPLTVRGAASHAASLFEAQDSTNAVYWKLNNVGAPVCMTSTCIYYVNGGAHNWTMNSFGDFTLDNGFSVGGNSVRQNNANSYTWTANDGGLYRLGVDSLSVGSTPAGSSNGAFTANTHAGQFVNLTQLQPYALAPTLNLTGAAGSISTSYYGCYFDLAGLLIGCTPVVNTAIAPVTPTGSNFYNVVTGAVPGAYKVQMCRQGGYATQGYIGTLTTGQSLSMNDTTGSTFLPGDGTVCNTQTVTSVAGLRMTAMRDQVGGAWLSQWADFSTFRPVFNDNNTGKKFVVGQTATIPAGHMKVADTNGWDDVDGGVPSTFITSITTSGTSGPATVAAGVLNVPNYAVATAAGVCSNVTTSFGANNLDNTGATDVGAKWNNIVATLDATSPGQGSPALCFPAGRYKVTTPVVYSGTTNVNNVAILCEGNASGQGDSMTAIQASTTIDILTFDFSSSKIQGPLISNCQFSDTSGTGAVHSAIHYKTVSGSKEYNVGFQELNGKDYSTGTVSVTNGSKTVTGSGTTFTSGMVPGILWINGLPQEVQTFNSATSLSLTTNYQGSTNATASYALSYNGFGRLFDPISTANPSGNFNQYSTFFNNYSANTKFPAFFIGGSSGSVGNSRMWFIGGYAAETGTRLPNSIAVHMGAFTDTIKWDVASNNYVLCWDIENGHNNLVNGLCENTGAFAANTTSPANGTRPSVYGGYVHGDSSSNTFQNVFSDAYCVQCGSGVKTGTLAQFTTVTNFRLRSVDTVYDEASSGVGATIYGDPERPLTANLTTTAAASDNVTMGGILGSGSSMGVTSASHCQITPKNSTAAAASVPYYTAATDVITVFHAVTSGLQYSISCSRY